MKLKTGEMLSGYLYTNGNSSSIEYKVKIIEIACQGEHFYFYKAMDCNGNYICIKTIRYKSEKKNVFSSALDYIHYRREMLFSEHKALAISHPSLPEPLAMITIENNTDEDEKLFRKFPQWQQLKKQEPILILEYFAGIPLNKLEEQIQFFSLQKRIALIKKIMVVFAYVHKQGFILQSLKLDHIILSPENDDNVYIVGLHYSCQLKNLDSHEKYEKAYLLSGQTLENEYRPDVRMDIFQLGLLLYYILTLNNPFKKSNIAFVEKAENALNKLSSTSSWLAQLLGCMISEREKRIASVAEVLSALESPPKEKIKFSILETSQSKIEIELSTFPAWGKNIDLRIEEHNSGNVIHKTFPIKKNIVVSGKWYGEITCGIRIIGQNNMSTWWNYESIFNIAKFPLQEITYLEPSQAGFSWEYVENLESVSFFLEENGQQKKLCTVADANKVLLPLRESPLPYYKKLKIICEPNFTHKEQNATPVYQEILLVPQIANPRIYMQKDQLFFEIKLTSQQKQLFSQIELFHNKQAYHTPVKEDFTQQIQGDSVIFKLNSKNLSLFEKHNFSCRILLDSMGWKKGPEWEVDIEPSSVDFIGIEEIKLGTLKLTWKDHNIGYLQNYEVFMENQLVASTKDNYFILKIGSDILIKNANKEIKMGVCSVYCQNAVTKRSQIQEKRYFITSLEKILQCSVKRFISPKSVKFDIFIKNYHILQNFSDICLYRKEMEKNGNFEIKTQKKLKENIILEDSEIEAGRTYNYIVRIDSIETDIINEIQEIPQMGITCSLESSNYEGCSWSIQIDRNTLHCINKNIEIHRVGTQESKIHKIVWDKNKTSLQFEDSMLIPGEKYQYYLFLFLEKNEKHEYFMGSIATKKFELEVDVQTSYNSSNIFWKPSPQGKVDGIEIYNEDGKLLATTKSDSIALENLEPEREYIFPLKYRYLSGYQKDGLTLKFKTKKYNIRAESVDHNTDSFRLKWEIENKAFAIKLRNFLLKVSGNVGEHELSYSTRSVQLKQLHPCTTYQWSISGCLKSGLTCLLAEGETITEMPDLQVNIDIGLVHHITWKYEKTPSILKIEVHRNDLPLIETDENELYDSDFKGGNEILYRFFYVMSDGRKLLAKEERVKSLSMQNLFSAVKIQPYTGFIGWDFNEIKNYKYFTSLELYNEGKSIYCQDDTDEKLVFEDYGEIIDNHKIGLANKSMNFELAIIGNAPTTRKCKKKWTLSIKGIKCQYQKLPTNFSVYKEYSRIYFEWDKMVTNFLDEISIERLSDHRIIYSGENVQTSIFDDGNGVGLEPESNYQYIVKLKYKNHQTLKKIDISLDSFDEDRVKVTANFTGSKLKVLWSPYLKTSITHIGWCKSFQSFVPKFLKRYHFVDFSCGNLDIPVYSKDGDFTYELVYKDCYNNVFYGSRRNVKLGEKHERNTL